MVVLRMTLFRSKGSQQLKMYVMAERITRAISFTCIRLYSMSCMFISFLDKLTMGVLHVKHISFEMVEKPRRGVELAS